LKPFNLYAIQCFPGIPLLQEDSPTHQTGVFALQ